VETLIQDLRFAARTLRRSPGFAVSATLTLALGIGANAAIFAIVDGVLFRPLPFPEPNRLVMVWQDHRKLHGPDREWTSPPNFLDWRDESTSFAAMAAVTGWSPTMAGAETSETLAGLAASYDVFRVLGVEPTLGRGFSPEEDLPGAEPVVVVSHELWQSHFGGDPEIVGRMLTLDGRPYTVIGVLPAGAGFVSLDGISATPQAWTPLQPDPDSCGRGCLTLRVLARLAPGVSLESAQTEMAGIAARLQEHAENHGVSATVVSLRDQVVGRIRPALLMLLVAVGFVLLLACANVANLLLARGAERQGEIAIRAMLGAGRPRLVRQLVTESVLLAILGGAAGILLAFWSVDFLIASVPHGMDVPRLDQVRIDGRVLAFTVGVTVVTGMVFGLIPAAHAIRPSLERTFRSGAAPSAPTTADRAFASTWPRQRMRSGRTRASVVVGEVAVAIVLLVGAGLLTKSFVRLIHVDRGFDDRNVLTMSLSLPMAHYPDPEDVRAAYGKILDVTARHGKVKVAAIGSAIPMGGTDADIDFVIPGRPKPHPGDPRQVAWYRIISPGYLQALGIPLHLGREFTYYDGEGAPLVGIVNELLARRYWGGSDPIGQSLLLGDREVKIVGVAGDVRNWGLEQEARPAIYLPHAQFPARTMSLVIRTRTDPNLLTPEIRRDLHDLDAGLAPGRVATLESIVTNSVGPHRLTTLLLSIFSAAALSLAAIGLYGVLSYTVTRRRHEIGVRIALGASAARVRARVVGQAFVLTATGAAIGLIVSWALSRFVSSLLYGVTPRDPLVFASVPLLLSIVALLASYIPARQATRVNPATVLRAE
jgi:putative ABC transport system permease protein